MHLRPSLTNLIHHNIFHGNQLPSPPSGNQTASGKTEYKSGPEFPLFSQHVLVALDTGHGVIYAPASGWNRVYLMWTFRNFHSLPQTVLNPRQQQLIGALYREAANHSAPELYEAPVVGTVEGFNPSSTFSPPQFLQSAKVGFQRIALRFPPSTKGNHSMHDSPSIG